MSNTRSQKNMLQRSLLGLLVSSLFSFTHAQAFTLDEAINKAGKQRMITQRVLKDYALVGMHIELGDPAQDLKTLIELFDSSLADLKQFSTSDAVNKSLAAIETQWTPIRATLQDAPDRDKAARLQEDLDKLLAACQENTRLIAQSADNKTGDIVNLAGRQRMLSQRMAALYMLKAWKLDDPKFREKLTSAMDEFTAAHKSLEASPLTTDEIHVLLAKVKKSFAWFEMMGRSSSNRVIPNLINKSANSIQADMDKATSLYAQSNQ
ncbi:type IV pili methyl-accepting chemotaxis transducer N-terminal domain-containing protein [Thiolapillus sp.]